jgi:Fe2+ transport system protein B
MYGWIWRHLPGNAWVRSVLSLVLVLAVVYLLFQVVFPWAEPLLPFNNVTVDNNNGMHAVTGVAAVL